MGCSPWYVQCTVYWLYCSDPWVTAKSCTCLHSHAATYLYMYKFLYNLLISGTVCIWPSVHEEYHISHISCCTLDSVGKPVSNDHHTASREPIVAFFILARFTWTVSYKRHSKFVSHKFNGEVFTNRCSWSQVPFGQLHWILNLFVYLYSSCCRRGRGRET